MSYSTQLGFPFYTMKRRRHRSVFPSDSSPDWTLYGETNSGATIIHVNQLYRAGPDVDAFAKHAPCQFQGAEVLTVEFCQC